MSRRNAALGGSATTKLLEGVDGFSTAGNGSWLRIASGSTTDLAAAVEMTVVAMFRVDTVPTATEYVISKGGGFTDAIGYSLWLTAASVKSRFYANAEMNYTPADPSKWAGKTFISVMTANGSGQQHYLWHDGLSKPLLVGSVATPTAPATDTRRLALGALRGTGGGNEADSLTIIGAGVGYTHLDEAAAGALMAACKAAGKVTSFSGEAARWNASDGAGITEDQVGSFDLTAEEDLSTIDAVSPFEPAYVGERLPTLLVLGQSNAAGRDDVVNWSTSPINYQAAYSAVRLHPTPGGAAWRDLEPVGDANSGLELSAGRDLDAEWVGDVHVVKYTLGSTDLANDWNPSGPGAQWTGWVAAWDEAQVELADPLDTLVCRCVAWIQGEADATDSAEAAAYQTNLGAFIDAVKAYTPRWTDWLFVIGRLPSFQSQTHKATVISAQDAVAAARSDTVIVNTDNLTDLDGLHYDADSLLSLGHAVEDAHTTQSNQTIG